MKKNLRKEYENYLINKKYAESTVVQYLKEFDDFRVVIEDKNGTEFDCSKLISDDILYYQNYLAEHCKNKKGGKIKTSTIIKRIEQLRAFNYFVKEEYPNVDLFKDFVQLKAVNEKNQKIKLNKEELEKLLLVVEDRNTYQKYDLYTRNKLIVHILLYLGLKVEEMRKIKREDIDLDNKIVKVKGKNYLLNEVLVESFKEFLDYLENQKSYLLSQVKYKNIELTPYEYNIVNSDYIFFSQREDCLGVQGVHHIFRFLKDLTKIENLTPKNLIETNKYLGLILDLELKVE